MMIGVCIVSMGVTEKKGSKLVHIHQEHALAAVCNVGDLCMNQSLHEKEQKKKYSSSVSDAFRKSLRWKWEKAEGLDEIRTVGLKGHSSKAWRIHSQSFVVNERTCMDGSICSHLGCLRSILAPGAINLIQLFDVCP